MKKSLVATAVLMTFASASAFAHHPSADVNPNYDRVDENISDMHNTVIDARIDDDMGSDMDGVGAGTGARGDMGSMANEDRRVMPGAAFEIDPEDAVDTIGLYGDVTSALSE